MQGFSNRPSRLDLRALRAAAWAALAHLRVRRDLRRHGIGAAVVAAPPELPEEAIRGVRAALRRRNATCLERSLVLQKWYEAHGVRRDVVVGVTAPSSTFAAHAWLDGDADDLGVYRELRRFAPR